MVVVVITTCGDWLWRWLLVMLEWVLLNAAGDGDGCSGGCGDKYCS